MGHLEVRDLVVDIPGRADGQPLSFTLAAGQVWGVLGPNGVGKTTLLHTLAGLRAPRRGEVLLDGRPIAAHGRREVARRLGLVFQERQDGFPATVRETALIGRHPWLSPWQMESGDDLRLAEAALARLDIGHLAERLVGTLSGGERQRVSIATVLAQAPGLWLCDEPTNHLDLHHQTTVMALLAERAAAGCAVMLCLHDLNLAARWCDQVLLLYPDGQACWGHRDNMLVPSVLEHLYGQRLASREIEGARVFVAVP
ncbi:ABC transporter ATP-binding protein [Halomonas urumqiensis]|uniref:ABC transporter n=1 Tax=Halomonas urumqiensis TaxID=1684789 RepID=A0A2N7UKU9_9GAMM|nr:ABC transporter ATP-binding protein [Halomonas urumqiensis]PMR81019.1 ABC transporter [Halomonas urumqiensis]PTB01124.1 ABC transporter ATP-binding protein [Halomonas urumqiensis]GHE22854.1 histidinol-phosphatase [Halomonas urumqiensis]